MALEELYKDVLDLLLTKFPQERCGMDILNLYQQLSSGTSISRYDIHNADDLERHLQHCTKLFEVETHGENGGKSSVSPKTSLTICRRHSNKGGSCSEGTCPDLHFCVFFLLSGQCRYDADNCYFGHNLRTIHNRKLLKHHLLERLSITKLRMLFCQPTVRQGVTLPQVCRYYNGTTGCRKGIHCFSMHVCLRYITDKCKYGKNCLRNHNITHPQVIKVLALYGVNVGRNLGDALEEIKLYHEKNKNELDEDKDFSDTQSAPQPASFYRKALPRCRKLPSEGQGRVIGDIARSYVRQGAEGLAPFARRASSASRKGRDTAASPYAKLAHHEYFPKTEELCLYHLQRRCRFKENCKLLHSNVPYLWRLAPAEEPAGRDSVLNWKGLPSDSNQRLEKAYSQPQETGCIVTDEYDHEVEIMFREMEARNIMTGQKYIVRRVSTQSSMLPSPQGSVSSQVQNFTTVWLWYWRNKDCQWSEIGQEEHGRLPFNSTIVEKQYQRIRNMPFKLQHFVLDFEKMRLTDCRSKTVYRVLRRPQFMERNDDYDDDDDDDHDHDHDDHDDDPDHDDYDHDDSDTGSDTDNDNEDERNDSIQDDSCNDDTDDWAKANSDYGEDDENGDAAKDTSVQFDVRFSEDILQPDEVCNDRQAEQTTL